MCAARVALGQKWSVFSFICKGVCEAVSFYTVLLFRVTAIILCALTQQHYACC